MNTWKKKEKEPDSHKKQIREILRDIVSECQR